MKKNLRLITLATAGALISLGFVSCAYDPYYSSSVGASYSSGYGGGSTSVFVSTGDPRWGYDPVSYSYYDYHRRCYYDPYLYGYYPVGYRPPVVYGVPHPYGWRPGSGICRPPSRVTNVTISNYRNRESAYRGSSYGWARQVRQGSSYDGRDSGSRSGSYSSSRGSGYQNQDARPSSGYRPSSQPSYRPSSEPSYRSGSQRSEGTRSEIRGSSGGSSSPRYPSQYNRPVSDVQRGDASRYEQRPSSSSYRPQTSSPAVQQQSVPRMAPGNSASGRSSGRSAPPQSSDGNSDGRIRGFR
jgi:hypothetical protein